MGLSLDGYEQLHDENRKFPDNSGSFARVMETARLFQEYQVEFNILTVVTAQSSKRIKRIYQYFGEQGFAYQQYIPCIDPFEETKAVSVIPSHLTVTGNF